MRRLDRYLRLQPRARLPHLLLPGEYLLRRQRWWSLHSPELVSQRTNDDGCDKAYDDDGAPMLLHRSERLVASIEEKVTSKNCRIGASMEDVCTRMCHEGIHKVLMFSSCFD